MLFEYRAYKDNKLITKKIEAKDDAAVLQYLRTNNFLPLEIKKAAQGSGQFFNFLFDKVSFVDIVSFTRSLAIMLNAGLTLIDTFEILKKQITKPSLYKLMESIDKEIREGNNFSIALKKYPQYFSNLYIALIRSGEASGKLSDILLKLADDLEKKRAFQAKLKNAMIYPVIIVIAMIGVIFVMVTFVLPNLLNLYKDFNVELPFTTQLLIAVSSFSQKFWPVIIAVVSVMAFLAKKYFASKSGKRLFDTLTLKLPYIKNVVQMSILSDATRTISILTSSGISILDGLDIIIDTTSNIFYQQAFKNIYKQVERGISLGEAMKNEGIFPPILVQMTIVGEQTGHLDETSMRIALYFESQTELATKAMTALIEPAILVVLGIGVGFLVLSVITPIYNLTGSFK